MRCKTRGEQETVALAQVRVSAQRASTQCLQSVFTSSRDTTAARSGSAESSKQTCVTARQNLSAFVYLGEVATAEL